jgi:hypothetical protein
MIDWYQRAQEAVFQYGAYQDISLEMCLRTQVLVGAENRSLRYQTREYPDQRCRDLRDEDM